MNSYAKRPEQSQSNADRGNKTGIPPDMQSSFERTSGFSFDDVKVHYGSEKPAQLRAHAYTQGSDVYVAPGQEKHLPHELGHVVQQKNKQVKPTTQLGGIPMNTDPALESNADQIAATAQAPIQAKMEEGVVQRAMTLNDSTKLYNLGQGFAGFATILGLLVGFGKYFYDSNREREDKYVEEIEKLADKAEEERDKTAELANEFNTIPGPNDDVAKTQKLISIRKSAEKVQKTAKHARFKYRKFDSENASATFAIDRVKEAEREAVECYSRCRNAINGNAHPTLTFADGNYIFNKRKNISEWEDPQPAQPQPQQPQQQQQPQQPQQQQQPQQPQQLQEELGDPPNPPLEVLEENPPEEPPPALQQDNLAAEIEEEHNAQN